MDDVENLREKSEKSPATYPQNYETYREMFEDRFLLTTEEYYAVLSNKLLNELSVSQFMEAVGKFNIVLFLSFLL